MSSSSLYYLFSNEQHYYRVNGLGVGYVVALTMAFATFCGTTLTAVNTHLNTNLAYYLLLAFWNGFVSDWLWLFRLSRRRRDRLVASFETATISTLIHTKTSSIVLLVVMALLISAAQTTNTRF
jgi:hypothetical protein